MADQTHTYNIQNDFPNQLVSVGKLQSEIFNSNVTIALRSVSSDSVDINIIFKGSLGTNDLALLDDIVAAHDGVVVTTPREVSISNTPEVITTKLASGSKIRTYAFSIDWTKKETWFSDAIKVSDEAVGTGDGAQTVFDLGHGGPTSGEAILNLTNGLVTDEHIKFAPNDQVPTGYEYGNGYSPLVLLDDGSTDAPFPQTEIKDFDPLQLGHYTIDHADGTIEFETAPGNSVTIVATYWYVPDAAKGRMIAGPTAGKKWCVGTVEAQFSEDLVMNDTVCQNIFAGETPVFPMDVEYRTMGAFFDYTYGSHPLIPPVGGPIRGSQKSTIVLRWDYATSICLSGNAGQTMRAWLKNGIEYGGERATVTWYAIEEDE